MRDKKTAFVADGLRRLLMSRSYREKQVELEAKIREKYSAELSAAAGYWERLAVEDKIKREIEEGRPSSYSLWSRA